MPSILVLMMFSTYAINTRRTTEVSVCLAGCEGLNATTLGHTVSVSPMFSLKVHLENPRAIVRPWCYVGGEVTVPTPTSPSCGPTCHAFA